MKPLLKIIFYLATSLLIGLFVAPWIYQLVQAIPSAGEGAVARSITVLQQIPFHRYVSRSVQIVGLLLLWPTVVSLRIERLSELSLYPNPHARFDFCYGLLVALLPLWLLQLFFLWQGWFLFNDPILWSALFRLVLTALVVAFAEEFFFRGLFLGLCRRFLTDQAALFFTALIFATVHFFNLPSATQSSINWSSGFDLLRSCGSALPAWPLTFGAFLNLFLAGMILAWVTIKTSSLWLAIGLHSAWIFGQQFFNLLAHYATLSPQTLFPWVGPSQIHAMVPVGLLSLLPIGVTLSLLQRFLQSRRG